ncbi:MAG: hypothetical protein AB7L09_00245 [Nitrospira sp.]
MGLPRDQRVSDLLHSIADLIQEADAFLCESSLGPAPMSAGKKLPRPKLTPTPFNSVTKKDEKGKNLFSGIKRKPLGSSGIEPHRVDSLTNRLRKTTEKLNPPERDVLRAKRERKQRSRYQANKLLAIKPQKSMGSRLRKR